MNIDKQRLILFFENSFFIIAFISCWFLNEMGDSYGRIVIVLSILSSILLIVRSENIQFLLHFFAISYWIVLYFYFFYQVPYHIYDEYQNSELTIKAVILQSVFLRLIYDSRLNYIAFNGLPNYKKSNLVFSICILILTLFAVVSLKDGGSILGVGYTGASNQGSVFLEYAIIPLIIGAAQIKTKRQDRIIIIFILIFMLLPVLTGKRMTFLYFGIAFFGLYFQSKLKTYQLFFGCIIAYFLVQLAGEYRDEFNIVNFQRSLLGMSELGVMQNNQGGVTIASTTYLGLQDQGILNNEFSARSIFGHLVGVVLPSDLLPEETFFNTYSMQFANIPGNGGYTAVYLYILFGWIGFVFATLIFKKLLIPTQYGFARPLLSALLISTFPRWFGYNIYPVLKLLFWAFVMIIIFEFLKWLTNRRFARE